MSAFTVNGNIEGNLGDDPILRYTPSGKAVANMRVAVTSRSRTNTGEFRERTEWVNVVAWGDLAENIAASMSKGDRIMVVGDYRTRQYENKDGVTVYVQELHADAIGAAFRWAVVAGITKAKDAFATFPDEAMPEEAPAAPAKRERKAKATVAATA